ncbi:MAG: VCBS repeat-containing protein, partial [Chthoniobacteraceae bacterium]
MSAKSMSFTSIEPLEARIAPAAFIPPTIIAAENDPTGSHIKTVTVNTPILLKAGDLLTTGGVARSGSYLLFVEKGQALVFTTDLNNNGAIDFNEITGISAGDGLRLVSFVDIHGDIVTNLRGNGTLSDSDNDSSNDDPGLKGGGRVLLDSRIEKIELRSLRLTDLTDQNNDRIVDAADIGRRIVLTSYSVFGQIIAGGGFGVKGDASSGLIIDDSGKLIQQQFFIGPVPGSPFGPDYYDPAVTPIKAQIEGIIVGSAGSGEYFSFGISRNGSNDPFGTGDSTGRNLLANGNDVQGYISAFKAASGATGAGIFNVRGATNTITFNIGRLASGDGGLRASGGNIENVILNGDDAGGYVVRAGSGGGGSIGGNGGSILDFQDLGSNTGQIIFQGGSGGTGSTGAGGNGGAVTFGTMNILGSVLVQEGDGGNGFTSGGNGASLSKAFITSPDRLADYVRNIVGTTHDTPHDPATGKRDLNNITIPGLSPLTPGIIGQGNPVDFDGDGIGDIVFTSSDPSQLVVQFGDGNGGFRLDPVSGNADRIYLNGPLDAEALTVGDFDGDGHLDIATASTRGGAYAGIYVFISKYEDTNRDGFLTKTEDLNGNGRDDLLGFFSPRFSPLPNINDAAVAVGGARSGHAIADLDVGDFNGDGFTDIAVLATYYSEILLQPFQILFFMTPDIEDGKPTGQFFADYGTKAQAVPAQSANPLLPLRIIAGNTTVANIETTALSVFSSYDVVIAHGIGSRTLQVVDNSVPRFFGPSTSIITLGQVDTDRDLPAGGNVHISLANVTAGDIAIHDFDNDGLADYSAISNSPAGYLVTLQGDGLGGARRIDGRYPSDGRTGGSQNLGFFFGPPGAGNVGGLDLTTVLLGIRDVDADGDGLKDDVAILFNTTGPNPFTGVVEMDIGFPPLPGGLVPPLPAQPLPVIGVDDNPGADRITQYAISNGVEPSVVAFDVYHPLPGAFGVPDTTIVNFAVGDRELINAGSNFIIGIGDVGFGFTPTSEHYLRFEAGDGGTGLLGRGGNGGNLGSGRIDRTTLVGSLDIHTTLGGVQFVG